jgi:hypothetical protein
LLKLAWLQRKQSEEPEKESKERGRPRPEAVQSANASRCVGISGRENGATDRFVENSGSNGAPASGATCYSDGNQSPNRAPITDTLNHRLERQLRFLSGVIQFWCFY